MIQIIDYMMIWMLEWIKMCSENMVNKEIKKAFIPVWIFMGVSFFLTIVMISIIIVGDVLNNMRIVMAGSYFGIATLGTMALIVLIMKLLMVIKNDE